MRKLIILFLFLLIISCASPPFYQTGVLYQGYIKTLNDEIINFDKDCQIFIRNGGWLDYYSIYKIILKNKHITIEIKSSKIKILHIEVVK